MNELFKTHLLTLNFGDLPTETDQVLCRLLGFPVGSLCNFFEISESELTFDLGAALTDMALSSESNFDGFTIEKVS